MIRTNGRPTASRRLSAIFSSLLNARSTSSSAEASLGPRIENSAPMLSAEALGVSDGHVKLWQWLREQQGAPQCCIGILLTFVVFKI